MAFTLHSYDQVGVREITNAAGVNSSLVNRYFGTKENLFAEVMHSGSGFEALDDCSFDQALARLADHALDRAMFRADFDPVLALIRSAPIASAQPVLQDYLTRHTIEPLARLIDGKDANERASLIVAFVIGIIILRVVIKVDPLVSTTRNDLAALIESAVKLMSGESEEQLA